MTDQVTRDQYTTTIGIECHVQLKTKTKLFAAVGNDAREAPPNTLVSHICFGLPGALPVLNEEAVELAIRAAFALGTEPERFSKFDRKHYFYPDLPKGYQISQFDEPIIGKGAITINVDGKQQTIGITRAHMEEDAGKSTHPAGADYSLVDLNRAGTPLLEIVSEPDMHTAAEAKAYARELYLRMRYADVSEANLYYGNMRFDVNVSVSKTDELGTRTETKNLNSFRSVERAIEYEVERQIEALENGETIIQETRGWDDDKQQTFSQRSKENADDYRYMPDPDIPPIVISEERIKKVKAEMPLTLDDLRDKLHGLNASQSQTEAILEYPDFALFLTGTLLQGVDSEKSPNLPEQVASWVIELGPKLAQDHEMQPGDLRLNPKQLLNLAEAYDSGKLSSTQAKVVFEKVVVEGVDPLAYAKENNLIQVSDEGEIAKIVEQVLSENEKAANDVKNGEMKAIGFLVGQVMKNSKGKANPSMAQDLIKKQLGL